MGPLLLFCFCLGTFIWLAVHFHRKIQAKPSLFINITVISTRDAVHGKIASRTPTLEGAIGKVQSRVRGGVANVAAKTVANAAKVSKQLSQKLPNEMPDKLSKKGIMVVAVCRMLKPPFFVLQVMPTSVRIHIVQCTLTVMKWRMISCSIMLTAVTFG